MPYSTALFDLDHTLFDSDASESRAFEITMRAAGIEDPEAHLATYRTINLELWAGVESGSVRPIDVRNLRFERLFSEIGVAAEVEALATLFVHSLGAHGALYPGAEGVLEVLASRARLGLVTNGLGDVQRARLDRTGITRYFDAVVISSEVGVTKPGQAIFDIAFDQLGSPRRTDAVMIGDSLTSDIRGGADYGIATCWYNPHGRIPGPEHVITHEIRRLEDVVRLVAG